MINLIISGITAVLWMVGDHKQAWARDLILPLFLGLITFLNEPFEKLWINLLVAICTAGACNIIRVGYGSYDPVNDDKPSFLAKVTKDKNGWIIRTVWGFLTATIACLPFIIASVIFHQTFYLIKATVFIVLFAFTCFLVVRLRSNVFWTGLMIGLAFSLITIVTHQRFFI